MRTNELVRGALLIALTLVLQSLRLVLPLPQPISTFIIGTCVSMMLLVTRRSVGFVSAALLALVLPVLAYFQGQLLMVPLIPIVVLGNLLYVQLGYYAQEILKSKIALVGACVVKSGAMAVAAFCMLEFLGIQDSLLRKTIMFAMSVPQLVTSLMGALLAEQLLLRFRG